MTAKRKWRRHARWPPTSASIASRWEITDHPEEMFSRRFLPGSRELAAIKPEVWDDNNLGNAIPGATPRAQIDVRQSGALAAIGRISSLPVMARPGRPVQIAATVKNLSTRAFPAQASYGRRLVRLGAQLCDHDRTVINRDFERAWLPATLQPGQSVEVPDDHHRSSRTGALRVEVRSGQRRDGLVRGVRVADNDEDAYRALSGRVSACGLVRGSKTEQESRRSGAGLLFFRESPDLLSSC